MNVVLWMRMRGAPPFIGSSRAKPVHYEIHQIFPYLMRYAISFLLWLDMPNLSFCDMICFLHWHDTPYHIWYDMICTIYIPSYAYLEWFCHINQIWYDMLNLHPWYDLICFHFASWASVWSAWTLSNLEPEHVSSQATTFLYFLDSSTLAHMCHWGLAISGYGPSLKLARPQFCLTQACLSFPCNYAAWLQQNTKCAAKTHLAIGLPWI